MIKYKFSSLSDSGPTASQINAFRTARKLVDLGQSERKTDLVKLSSLMSSVVNACVGEDYAAIVGYITGANHVLSGQQMIDFESLETAIIGDIFERYIHVDKDQPTMGSTARSKMYYNMFLMVFKFGYIRGKDEATALIGAK